MLAVLKHTRTEVCSKTAEHAKMLVFYLNIKARMIMKQGKGVRVVASMMKARKGKASSKQGGKVNQ